MITKILKNLNLFGRQDGLAQIPLMIALLLMAVAIPAVSKLSQQNQDTRNKAAYSCSEVTRPADGTCQYGWSCNTETGNWQCKASGATKVPLLPTSILSNGDNCLLNGMDPAKSCDSCPGGNKYLTEIGGVYKCGEAPIPTKVVPPTSALPSNIICGSSGCITRSPTATSVPIPSSVICGSGTNGMNCITRTPSPLATAAAGATAGAATKAAATLTAKPTAIPTLRDGMCRCPNGTIQSCASTTDLCTPVTPSVAPGCNNILLRPDGCACSVGQCGLNSGCVGGKCVPDSPSYTPAPTRPVVTAVPTLKYGTCTTLSCPAGWVKNPVGSYPYTECYCAPPAATLTPASVPTGIKKCDQITDATECAYYPGCLYLNGKCGTGGSVPTVTTGSSCTTTQVGGSRCNVSNGNAETCNKLSNGSTYWQGTACAYGCSAGKCKPAPTAVPTAWVKKCAEIATTSDAGITECAYYPGCLYDPLKGCIAGGYVPTITSGSNCSAGDTTRCNNGNVETCKTLSNGSKYWQGLACAYGCNFSSATGASCNSKPPACGDMSDATECAYTPGCYYYNGKCNPTKPTIAPLPTLVVKPTGQCVPGAHVIQASLLGCPVGTKRTCDCGTNAQWSCFCDTDDNGLTCSDSVNGTRGSNGTWLHVNDLSSAKCVCGDNNFHQNANGTYQCGPGSSGGNPTVKPTSGGGAGNPSGIPPISCANECTDDFKCYNNGSEFKWFSTGYVMSGFSLSSDTTCGGVAKPPFLGKSKGDANCDGINDVTDFSSWHKEFFDGDKGAVIKSTWSADFTGPAGTCDGVVDVYDFSLWQKFFNDLF